MLTAVFYRAGDIRLEEMDEPQPGPDEIVVAVAACGICGSDLHAYERGLYVEAGQVMGHELSGLVSAVGSQVSEIAAGDRVAVLPYLPCGRCNACKRGLPNVCAQVTAGSIAFGLPGGFAEHVRVPRAQLGINVHHLPKHLSFERAALAEPLAVALHSVALTEARPDEPVVVIGAGAIGLLTVAGLRSKTPVPIVVVDVLPNRLQAAERLGATISLNPLERPLRSALRDADIRPGSVIECSGAATALDDTLHLLPAGGQVVTTALYGSPPAFDASLLVRRELRMRGSFAATETDFANAISLLAESEQIADVLITHRFPLSDAPAAFAQQADRSTAIKVMVTARN